MCIRDREIRQEIFHYLSIGPKVGGNCLCALFQVALVVKTFQHELDDFRFLVREVFRDELGPQIVLKSLAIVRVNVPAGFKVVVIVIILALVQIVILLIERIKPFLLFDGLTLLFSSGRLHNVDYRVFQCQFIDISIQLLGGHLKNLS